MPAPGRLSTRITPVAADEAHDGRQPRPVPVPIGLVVKKRIENLVEDFGRMPVPVSATSSTTCGPAAGAAQAFANSASTVSARASSVSRPPAGMASRALMQRFMSTWCRWVRLPRTAGRSGATRDCTDTFFGKVSATILSMSRISGSRARATWPSSSPRPNISSCRRMPAPRWALVLIRSSRLRPAGSCTESSKRSAPSRTGERMLLRSWAMPPARRGRRFRGAGCAAAGGRAARAR